MRSFNLRCFCVISRTLHNCSTMNANGWAFAYWSFHRLGRRCLQLCSVHSVASHHVTLTYSLLYSTSIQLQPSRHFRFRLSEFRTRTDSKWKHWKPDDRRPNKLKMLLSVTYLLKLNARTKRKENKRNLSTSLVVNHWTQTSQTWYIFRSQDGW